MLLEVIGEVMAHVMFLAAVWGMGLLWDRLTKGSWFPDREM